MATAPNLVVAGDTGIARKLRETGRFPAVFDVASAAELRNLSRRGEVTPPVAFMFAPGFVEDIKGAGVVDLADGLASNGFTVLVHSLFTERGDAFTPEVQVTDRKLRMSELLAALGVAEPKPKPESAQLPRQDPVRRPEPAPQAPATPQPAPPSPQMPRPTQSSQPTAEQQVWPRQPQSAAQANWASSAGPSPHWGPSPRTAPPTQGAQAAQSAPRPRGDAPQPLPPQAVPAAPPQAVQPQAVQPLVVPARPPQAVPAPASNRWPGARAAAANPSTADAPIVAKRGRVVAVASAKGGVGKTSVTVNLAIQAARILQSAGRAGSVALVDTNFQQADVARYLNVKSPTILDLLRTPGGISAETIRNHLAHVPEIGLYALLGPPEAINADPSLIDSLPYQRILAVLRRTFDFVFIDTPVAELYHTTFTDLILPEADMVLVLVESSRVTLEAARSWMKAVTAPRAFRGGGIAPEKLSLVLNRARIDVDCSPEDVMDLLPGWRFVGMIPENHEWMRATNNYQLIAMRPDPELEATFRSILHVLTGDPVFSTAAIAPRSEGVAGRLKSLLGLNST
jgi:MinD-like ATPase involved in chromosome partitioning or flagellar assembly